jgi:hypothetical protein
MVTGLSASYVNSQGEAASNVGGLTHYRLNLTKRTSAIAQFGRTKNPRKRGGFFYLGKTPVAGSGRTGMLSCN